MLCLLAPRMRNYGVDVPGFDVLHKNSSPPRVPPQANQISSTMFNLTASVEALQAWRDPMKSERSKIFRPVKKRLKSLNLIEETHLQKNTCKVLRLTSHPRSEQAQQKKSGELIRLISQNGNCPWNDHSSDYRKIVVLLSSNDVFWRSFDCGSSQLNLCRSFFGFSDIPQKFCFPWLAYITCCFLAFLNNWFSVFQPIIFICFNFGWSTKSSDVSNDFFKLVRSLRSSIAKARSRS